MSQVDYFVYNNNQNDTLLVQQQQYQPHEPYDFDFHQGWHPPNRSDRFPSVQERVRLYMGNWYLPPCSDDDLLRHSIDIVDTWPRAYISDVTGNYTVELDSIVDADFMFLLTRDAIHDCARTIPQIEQEGQLYTESRVKHRINLQSYCSEVVGLVDYMNGLDYFTPTATKQFSFSDRERTNTPIVAQFGDNHAGPTNPQIPIIAKWRAATTQAELRKATTTTTATTTIDDNNIDIVNINDDDDNTTTLSSSSSSSFGRHCVDLTDGRQRPPLNTTVRLYEGISPIIWKLEMCRHWDPLEQARREDVRWHEKKLGALWRGDLTGKGYAEGLTDEQVCFANQRCQFVFRHRHSQYIDAGLSDGLNWLVTSGGNISGVPVIKDRVTMQQIQQYKVIISFEGNDVASGLKWSLLSESVVLMPPPTKTSWAMEELLEPWVHYIPMHPTGDNAEEMVQWVGDHDEEAHRIAERGRLFMYDLVYHPDAAREEQEVKAEIARRYRALWHQ